MVDPNKYKIVAERYTRYFDVETVTIFEGALRTNMEYLFESMKEKQGPNLIQLRLVNESGETIASYP